jgi:hypothetical protein
MELIEYINETLKLLTLKKDGSEKNSTCSPFGSFKNVCSKGLVFITIRSL